YGVDVFGEAVEKAKKNVKRFFSTLKSGQKQPAVYFINRDFFEVELDHVVDEIITDMPFAMGKTTSRDIEGIYRRFFEAADRILSDEGHLILYTRDLPFVLRYSKAVGFVIKKQFEISAREGTYVCVLGRRNEV
ncbi:MAG: hypothetical protein ILP10_02600, partial [Lachnospiraceae bacterium]|nr:hypothetical protein [Lachnospiraceae bacterium]